VFVVFFDRSVRVLSGISVTGIDFPGVQYEMARWLVEPSSTSSAIAGFLFYYITMDTSTEVTVQWLVHRKRGARVIMR
jgi:hypothetical protein